MKFLLYGHNGWIAKRIVDIIQTSGDTVHGGKRVTTLDNIVSEIVEQKPDIIISALGRTNGPGFNTIDYLEQHGALSENICANLVAPVLIAQAALVCGDIPILYIGSGCIFEYDTNHAVNAFTEDDTANFYGSSYSIVKGQTDDLFRGFPKSICARIRMPITDESDGRDFITKIRRYNSIVSIPNSMSILSDLLPILLACTEAGQFGVLNAVNPGLIDHKNILDFYNLVEGRTVEYQLTTETAVKNLIASRRSNNSLSSTHMEHLIDILPERLKLKYSVRSLKSLEQRIFEVIRARLVNDPVSPAEVVGKVILVTGGAGFIASNWINFWAERHPLDRIVNIDCLGRNSNMRNILVKESRLYKFIHGNLLNADLLKDLFRAEKFTHVIHFAALSNVDHSFSSPLECTESNVLATHVLLEAARSYGQLALFVFISTDEVYGEISSGSFTEDSSVFQPTNPYSASKAGAECLVKSYGKAYKLPYIITRANNIYGKNQCVVNAVPRFINNIAKGQRMPVHGTGSSSRRFLHVLDKCRAIEILLNRGVVGETYNIGTNGEVTVLELCQLLLEISGKSADLDAAVEFVPDRVYNDCRYAVDTEKIEALGWRPKIQLMDGLKDVVNWYSTNLHHWEKA